MTLLKSSSDPSDLRNRVSATAYMTLLKSSSDLQKDDIGTLGHKKRIKSHSSNPLRSAKTDQFLVGTTEFGKGMAPAAMLDTLAEGAKLVTTLVHPQRDEAGGRVQFPVAAGAF